MTTWTGTKRYISNGLQTGGIPGYSMWANVSAYGPTVHVAWEDDRTGNIGIFYKSSADDGQTWGGERSSVILGDKAKTVKIVK